MRSILSRVVCQCIFAMAVAAALVTPAFAQDGNIRSITFYTVKPDRIGDFQAEIKEYDAILVKGGSERYASTWVSLTGPREYAHVSYYTKWADLDAGPEPKMKEQAADLARITVRIVDCTESSHRSIEEVLPDFTLSSGEMPKMIRVLVTQVRPDRFNEYLELARNEILPAVKRGEVKDYNFSETRFGASSTEVVSVAGLSSWADLDGGFGAEKGLGKEGYQALLNKVRPLIVSSEYNVYRFEPDLSYLPPPPAAK
jgi:hypothetical protein